MPTVVIFLAVLWLTLAPRPIGDTRVSLFEGADKCMHGLMFAALTASLLRDRARSRKRGVSPLAAAIAALATALLGVATELMQESMHLGRSFEWGDIAADSLGAILGACLARMIYKKTGE